VTQGYGEQYLRVQTDGPSRENRRVQVRNITGLMAGGPDGQPGGPDGGPPDGPPGGPPQGQPPG
jgi:OmpA-OmpF porin, OOP family